MALCRLLGDEGISKKGKGARMTAKKIVMRMLYISVTVLLIGGGLFRLWWFSKPVVVQNYPGPFREIREPQGYDSDMDGWHLLVGAWTAASSFPRDIRRDMSPADMNDAQREEIRSWVAENVPVLELVDRAMAKKYIIPRLPWQDMAMGNRYQAFSEINKVHSVRVLFIWRGRMKAWDGDVKGGIADVLAAAKIVRRFGDKLTWDEWGEGAVGTANCCQAITDIVKWAKLSDDELAALSKEVQDISSQWEDIEWPLAFQRLTFLDMVQQTFTDNGNGDGRVIPAVLSKMWAYHYGSRMENFFFTTIISLGQPGRKATIECYDRVVQACKEQWGKKTPPVPREEPGFMDAITHAGPPRVSWVKIAAGNALVRSYLPGDEQSLYAFYCKRNEAARTLVTIAVARYKVSTGHLPDTLAEVIKSGYLQEPVHPIFSTSEFIYEKKGDSFVVYLSATEKLHKEENDRIDAEWKGRAVEPNAGR
jgi:hypothetical protein